MRLIKEKNIEIDYKLKQKMNGIVRKEQQDYFFNKN